MFLVLSTVKSPMRVWHPENRHAQRHAVAITDVFTCVFMMVSFLWFVNGGRNGLPPKMKGIRWRGERE